MYLVDVLVEHPVHSLDTTFTYLSNQEIPKGVRVAIQFNRQSIVGYVLKVTETNLTKEELEERDGFKYRYLGKAIDEEPLLNDELMELGIFMSDITLSPRIACYQMMLPPSLKPKTQKAVGIKTQKVIYIVKEGQAKTDKQQAAYDYIKAHQPVVKKTCPYSSAVLDNLKKQGLIDIVDEEVLRTPEIGKNDKQVILTKRQQEVVEGILNEEPGISLIHGVTGSGKTEVYLALTKEMIKRNKTIIMLVPEISLTPMMVKQFKGRFGDDVAILHSRLSQGEKYDEYRRIQRGDVHIVIGARSAIFAPLDDIGLIIMDEEHDQSYKQDNNPRYHTLSIASWRAKRHQAQIVLGSATPRIESYARALKGVYHYYPMKQRINKKPLPHVDIVDMTQETRQGHYSLLSRLMINRIQETLDHGEQAIILLNKRGYASFVKCNDCQEIIKCPHCDVSLTYHKYNDQLVCHYCGFTSSMPHSCPECHGHDLKKIGYGTQKIEEELAKTFKNGKVIRFDFDTTRRKNDHLRLLESFANQEANILLGTQMIAKGLDFPNVTFVGVLMADLTLTLPDFRASERTFDLLTQVAGRSGRGDKAGTVVIQTFNPTHYAINDAASQDYEAFYAKEIEFRHDAIYPPFCHMVAVTVSSMNESEVKATSEKVKYYLERLDNIRMIGPGNIFKIQDIYRQRLLIKYIQSAPVYEALSALNNDYSRKKKGSLSLQFDFNPYTMI